MIEFRAPSALPRPGSIPVLRVELPRRSGRRAQPARPPRRGTIPVERVASLPRPGTLIPTPGDPHTGPTGLGRIDVPESVVGKIAASAAGEIPDAGAVAMRLLGNAVPGLARMGGRRTDLTSLPKTSADVDGRTAFVQLEISVRYPSPVGTVAEQVRERVVERLAAYAGLDAVEVQVTVSALVTELPAPPRVR